MMYHYNPGFDVQCGQEIDPRQNSVWQCSLAEVWCVGLKGAEAAGYCKLDFVLLL